jgi:hypothetical protein
MSLSLKQVCYDVLSFTIVFIYHQISRVMVILEWIIVIVMIMIMITSDLIILYYIHLVHYDD